MILFRVLLMNLTYYVPLDSPLLLKERLFGLFIILPFIF